MPEAPTIDTGNTAWLLISSALVLLMTPGSGAVLRRPEPVQGRPEHDDDELLRDRAHLDSLARSTASPSPSATTRTASGATWVSTSAPRRSWPRPTCGARRGIPLYVFMAFQMMFAIITVALISGAHLRPGQVRRLAALRLRLGHPGLLPGRAHGLGRRLHRRRARRAGLRRWHRRAHQRRCGGPRPGPGARQAGRLAARSR